MLPNPLHWLSRPEPPTIVEARTAQAPMLARLHATGFERGWDAYEFEHLLAEPSSHAHLALAEREAIGFALSRLVLDEAEVLSVAVLPRARGRGVGGLLLRHHLSRLAGRGARAVVLEVAADNAPAIRLYRAAGFEESGRRPAYYARRGGPPMAALLMRRDLG